MTKTQNRVIALLLVVLQIVLLLTMAMPQTKAAENTAAPSTGLPALNKTIRGTVQFSSFNFPSGVPDADKEGADYVVPFIYSDDYFAKPSYSETGSRDKQQNWSALEEKSLATASLNFALSCFGSNESIVSADYSNYAKNGIQFLRACEFSDNIQVNDEFCAIPTTDSVGVIIGSKDITVWNSALNQNEPCKLIAIGIRGGGYGAEWASNLSLGASGVHQGFREGADKVERELSTYLGSLNLAADEHVKYWVVGYSRAGAVANLVAGDLTVKNGVDQKDVYGYTFEAAAGASMTQNEEGTEPVDAGDTTCYPNIHNIINKMDAVPRVSISQFKNNRLGVDYELPYRVNAPTLNESYYQRMYSILRTVALGYYDENGSLKADPGLTYASPNSYPYKDTIKLYYLSLSDVATSLSLDGGLLEYLDKHATAGIGRDGTWKGALISDAFWDSQGATVGSGWFKKDAKNGVIYLDKFLDHLVTDLFSSQAWDYSASLQKVDGHAENDQLQHRQKYVDNGHQAALRHLIGLAMATPGAKMNDLFDKLGGLLGEIANDLLAAAGNLATYGGINDEKNAEDLSKDFRRIIVKVLHQLPSFAANDGEAHYSMTNRSGIGSTTYNISQQTGSAVETVAPVFTRMYLYDREKYGSQYIGTLLKFLNTILVTHSPEVSISWLMTLDENYTSDYRKITLPKNTDIKMYAFRGAYYNENLDFDANANVVAEFKNGEQISSLDGRIDFETGSDTITIWYPGNLDIRFDVKALADVTVRSNNATLLDYEPALDSNNVQGTNLKVVDYTSSRKSNGNVPDTVNLTRSLKPASNNVQTATDVNDFLVASSIPLEAGETLQLLAQGGSNSLDNAVDAEYTIRKSAIKVVAFGEQQIVATNVGVMGQPTGTGGTFAMNGSNLTFTPTVSGKDLSAFSTLTSSTYQFVNDRKQITAQSKVDVIPATNIYYKDSVVGTVLESKKQPDGKISSDSVDIKFFGTGIDAYCVCDSDAGYVKAELLNADGSAIDGVKAKVMNNNYTGELYNVPSIHFDLSDRAANTYILRLTASFGKDYTLNGVRVFNESHEDPVESKLAQVDEGEAVYVNIRDLLLSKKTADSLSDVAYEEGAVYFTGDAERQSPADYEAIGPKRELYLTQSGQGVAFNVLNPDALKVEIGLRNATDDSGKVKINGAYQDVIGTDQYYLVTPVDGNVSISYDDQCSGDIAITYIKLTAKSDVAPAAEVEEFTAIGPQRIRASAKLLAFVNAPDSEPTPDVTPSPEPESSPTLTPVPTSVPTPDPTLTPTPSVFSISALTRLIWNNLRQSVSRLFGGW